MLIGLLFILIGFAFMGYSLVSLYRKSIKKINALGYVPKDSELTSLVRSVVRDKANSTQANAFVFGILTSGIGIIVTFIMLVISLI
jgi:hypothetical protein